MPFRMKLEYYLFCVPKSVDVPYPVDIFGITFQKPRVTFSVVSLGDTLKVCAHMVLRSSHKFAFNFS